MIRLLFYQAKESVGCCVYVSSCPSSIRHSIPKMSTYYLRVPKNSMSKIIMFKFGNYQSQFENEEQKWCPVYF